MLSSRARRRAIGIAVIVAAMLIVLLAALRPTPFAGDRSYWAEFDSVQGLGSIDRDIRVAGANVGEIGEVVQEGDDARVELVISDDEVDLREDARADLRPHTLFEGSAFIDLSPGTPQAEQMDEGGEIPIERTSVYVSLDSALRILREPVREGFQGLVHELAVALRKEAIAGLQRTLANGPALTRDLAKVSRAIQGPRGVELQGAVQGLADTVDDVAEEEDQLIPLAQRANATLTALEVDGGRPLDQAIAELPGALEELRRGGPALARTIDGLRVLAKNTRPAIPNLKSALAKTKPLLDRSLPVLKRLRPMLADLRTVVDNVAAAAPTLRQTVAELLPGARILARSVFPVLTAESRLGQPAYQQLASMFVGANGAIRPYMTDAQGLLGEGHMIRLAAYLDPIGFASNVPISCDIVQQIDPGAAATLKSLGLCQ